MITVDDGQAAETRLVSWVLFKRKLYCHAAFWYSREVLELVIFECTWLTSHSWESNSLSALMRWAVICRNYERCWLFANPTFDLLRSALGEYSQVTSVALL